MNLPSYPAYLSSVIDLGRRSLKPALPALGLLYFYRLGMGAYVALSDYTLFQGKDALGAFGPQVAIIASFLPLLFLIYTPFLPLQDSLLRGQVMTFLGAIRRVLEQSVNFMLSGIAQALVFCVPIVLISVVAGVLLPSGDSAGATSPRMLFLMLTMLAVFGWILLATFFMMFATPAVVLDGEGPLQSLRTSVQLVSGNLGGLLGRLAAFGFLAVVAYVVATFPASILGAVERSAEGSMPMKLAGVVWTSAVDALFIPFWIASLMVLYRSLRSAASETWAQAPIELGDESRPATAARAPFE